MYRELFNANHALGSSQDVGFRNGFATKCRKGGVLNRKIVGFHQDERLDWVADLECGHGQHVRHNPPWMLRPWVITPEGRETWLGAELDCRRCDEEERSADPR